MLKYFCGEKLVKPIISCSLLSIYALPIALAKSSNNDSNPDDHQLKNRPRALIKMSANRQIEQLPAGLPVPVYRNNVKSTSYRQSSSIAGSSISTTIQTSDSPQIAYDWYETALARGGWTLDKPKNFAQQSEMQRDGSLYMLRANKDKYGLIVICAQPPHAPYTVINVSIANH